MLRKNLVPFSILLILAIAGMYYFFTKRNSTLGRNEFEFQVKDSSLIQKIGIKNPQEKIEIEKTGADWIVNTKYPANLQMMKLFFRFMGEGEIQSVLSADYSKKAEKFLKEQGALVSVELQNGATKEFYIFANKLTHQTWMMMKNGGKPFVVHIPAYEGNFAALFYVKSSDWRMNAIMLPKMKLKSIVIKNFNNREKSFSIDFSAKKPILYNFNNKITSYNMESMEQYFYGLKNIVLENYIYKQSSMDSLKKTQPLFSIKFNTLKNQSTECLIFPKGNPADLNNAYILVNNTDLAVVKYMTLDPMLTF